MSDDIALLYASDGSRVRLRAAGEWVAREAARLEPLTRSIPGQALGAPSVEIDLTEVTRLDTLGAKLIDQIRGMLTAAGTRVEITTGDEAQRVLLAEIASHRL